MDLYIPNEELQKVSQALTEEKVKFEVTKEVFSLLVEEKKVGEYTKVKADIVETDVPVIFDQGPGITLRAFRLPSGRKFIITDADGNFVRLAEPPPGWER
uniref:Uncharacterized protein n=1 Tax=Desulfobacca acetoxidans TaxID=60893 RepID=A0A7C3V809_9BACT